MVCQIMHGLIENKEKINSKIIHINGVSWYSRPSTNNGVENDDTP